jgi:hypothetical protein
VKNPQAIERTRESSQPNRSIEFARFCRNSCEGAGLRAKRPCAELGSSFASRLIDEIPIEIRPDRIAPLPRHAAVRMRIMPKIGRAIALARPLEQRKSVVRAKPRMGTAFAIRNGSSAQTRRHSASWWSSRRVARSDRSPWSSQNPCSDIARTKSNSCRNTTRARPRRSHRCA